jgi:RNA polymerase sigma factor (sigma-70 family)
MMTFEKIYKTHYSKVKFAINKIVKNTLDAEELASETMIRVHKALPSYREDLSKLSTWIINIAKNAAIDHIRKKKLQTVALEDVYVDWANGDESAQTDHLMALKCDSVNPEEKMIEAEVKSVMDANFNQLNKVDQTIATLHYFDGLSYEEVASEMNMPLGTVKAKIHKARVRLMEAFPAEMRKLATIER